MFFPEIKSEEQSVREWEAYKPKASVPEVIEAAWDRGNDSMSIGGKISSVRKKSRMDDYFPEMVSKDDANEELKPFGISVSEDTSRGEVKFFVEHHTKTREREAIIESNSDSILTGSIIPFTASAIASFANPVDLGIGILTGFGAGKALTAVAAKTTSVVAARMASSKIGTALVQGLAGNVPIEMGIAGLSKATKDEYTMDEAFINAVTGTALMTGVFAGAGALFKRVSKIRPHGMKATSDIVDGLIDGGKNPDTVLDIIHHNDSILDEITPEFDQSVRTYFPEKAGTLLDDPELKASDIMETLRKEHPDKVKPFLDDLESHGQKKNTIGDPEATHASQLSDDAKLEITEKLKARESDFDYDPKSDNILKEIPENFKGDEFDTAVEMKKQEITQELEANYESFPDELKSEYDVHKATLADDQVKLDAKKSFYECMTGVV